MTSIMQHKPHIILMVWLLPDIWSLISELYHLLSINLGWTVLLSPASNTMFPVSKQKMQESLYSRSVHWSSGTLLVYHPRVASRLAPSQWETSLQSNAISHWLGANLESALPSLIHYWGLPASVGYSLCNIWWVTKSTVGSIPWWWKELMKQTNKK